MPLTFGTPIARAGTGAAALAAAAALAVCAHGVAGAERSGAAPAERSAVQRLAASSASYVVRRGDTVFSIARRHGAGVEEIRRMNGLDRSYAIRVGQTLRLPNRSIDDGLVTGALPSSGAAAAQSAPQSAPWTAPAAAPAPVSGGAGRMARPVSGKIVRPFAARTGAATSAGVDLAAKPGERVFAAADGEVAFVSDGVSPVGAVMLIKHAGGMISVYGRIYDPLVAAGDQVGRGQPVARVAAPRGGGDAMLHFGLRQGAEPIDPTPFL